MTTDIMERGTLVRERPSNLVSPALRYLTMRVRAVTQTHQAQIAEFQRSAGAHYPDVPSVTRAYMARFKLAYEEAQERHAKAVAEIMADRAMDSMRKRQAVANLRNPLTPAWTDAQERGFLNTYGEPRRSVSSWNAELALLAQPDVPTINGGEQVMYHRTPWELFVVALLAEPELDGSVAPCLPLGSEGVVELDPNADIRATMAMFAPPVQSGQVDSAYYEAMMKAANAVCPHCHELFPRGLKAHEAACSRRHDVPSVYADEGEPDGPTN